ncbi:PREDICTED: coiled-coil domain-containing protein C1orf110 homolog [Elephantulus edwardii]|uniref:coiled-coil domain-containing protein C1orf110 homolog n=1 Tax=Elephantulus edwardii TaxID=28737 RepID=UPI0003F0D70C|nr:PREDICTED: coiled-coil domain-containing protein C1orf110 homolog [Elephantulus edwardii]
MKRLERHMVRGPMHRHFDLERKTAKQAEARLSQSLQRLEAICLYHMKLLTREQRQLQRDLQRLQQAELIKKKFSSYLADGLQGRPDALQFSLQGEQKHRVLQPNKFRSLAINIPQEIYKSKSLMLQLHHTGPMRSKEQLLFQNYRAANLTEKKPPDQENKSKNPPEGIDSCKSLSIPDQDLSNNTTDINPGSSPIDDSIIAQGDESISTDGYLQTDQDTGEEISPSPMGCTGNINEEATRSNYLELFAKVKNAHYLRHRVPPESERLLSIGEIFGHEKSLPWQEGKECENKPTTSSPTI